MALELDATHIRVLGALMEKELTTPDQYPLTLASLVAACNQKTSRDPVMDMSAGEVEEALQYLIGEFLVRERNPAGSRVSKYSHRLSDSLGLSFDFTRSELSVLAVLMLRGPQTPGEIKTRSERMRGPDGSDDMAEVLASLELHERGTWVEELPKEPGRRENRWRHLFGVLPVAESNDDINMEIPGEEGPAPSSSEPAAPSRAAPAPREALEARIAALEGSLEELAARITQLESDRDA